MRVAYTSDLHLEFSSTRLVGEATILILAGDILLARDIVEYPWADIDCVEESANARYQRSRRYYEFFKTVSSEFEYVLVIAGNHEHYQYDFSLTDSTLKANYALFDNVYYLSNSTKTIEGVEFAGTTLWSDVLKNPVETEIIRNSMNDYKIIKNFDVLTSSTAFEQAVEFIRFANPDVSITHHAPSYSSIQGAYVSNVLNAAYASDLSKLILDSKISYWIHGHIHEQINYQISKTNIVSNPRGYSYSSEEKILQIFSI